MNCLALWDRLRPRGRRREEYRPGSVALCGSQQENCTPLQAPHGSGGKQADVGGREGGGEEGEGRKGRGKGGSWTARGAAGREEIPTGGEGSRTPLGGGSELLFGLPEDKKTGSRPRRTKPHKIEAGRRKKQRTGNNNTTLQNKTHQGAQTATTSCGCRTTIEMPRKQNTSKENSARGADCHEPMRELP